MNGSGTFIFGLEKMGMAIFDKQKFHNVCVSFTLLRQFI